MEQMAAAIRSVYEYIHAILCLYECIYARKRRSQSIVTSLKHACTSYICSTHPYEYFVHITLDARTALGDWPHRRQRPFVVGRSGVGL